MNESVVVSFLALIQLVGLVLIVYGTLGLFKVWYGSESVIAQKIDSGTPDALASFRDYLSRKVRATRFVVVGSGVIILLLGGASTVALRHLAGSDEADP